MAKNSKKTIALDEIKIMDALEQHAKDDLDKIAKCCGFSRQKVWRFIKDLEKRKIIWGYTTITNETAKNLKHFTVLVKRSTLPFDEEIRNEIISRKLDDYPMNIVKIENIYLTHGSFDWILTFYAPNLVSAKKFTENIFTRLNKYFKSYDLIETLVPIRKYGLKNPQIKDLVEFI